MSNALSLRGPALRRRVAIGVWTALVATGVASSVQAAGAVRNVPATTGPVSVDVPSAAPTAGTSRDLRTAKAPEKGELSVTVDRAKIIRLPDGAQTVIIGNPAIADLSIQKSGVVVLTGKSYGATNLIALDRAGNMLAESNVTVDAPSDAVVMVQRGLERQSYSCNPACLPSIALGDGNTFFSENKSQAEQHNQLATQH